MLIHTLRIILAVIWLASGIATAAAQETEPSAVESSQKAEQAFADSAKTSYQDMDKNELTLRLLPLSREEVGVVAQDWFGLLQTRTKEIVDEMILLQGTEGVTGDQLREKVAKLTADRNNLIDRFQQILQSWENKAGDADKIAEYRAFNQAITAEERKAADVKTLTNQAVDWALSMDGGIQLLFRIVTIVLSFLVLLLVARMVRRIARNWIARVPNLSHLLQAFLILVIYWLTIVVGILMVLVFLGVDVTPVFAIIGGASFIIAFALQNTLGNLASGLLIMITRPFDVGQYIEAAGVAGIVENTSIVSTKIKTVDNQVIIVPNNSIWGSIITNVNAMPTRRVDLVFGIGYDDDINLAKSVLEETVAAHPLVLAEPKTNIQVHELADSSVNFICRPWAKTEDYWTVYWDLVRQVKEKFDANGISIPYPQQDVHMHQIGEKN